MHGNQPGFKQCSRAHEGTETPCLSKNFTGITNQKMDGSRSAEHFSQPA